MSETLRYKTVKTRKAHRCFGCGRLFPKGAIMEFSVFADNGTLNNCYLCQTCLDVLDERRDISEFCFGELMEDALELEREKGEEK